MITESDINKYQKELISLYNRIDGYREIDNKKYVSKLEKRANEVEFILKSIMLEKKVKDLKEELRKYKERYGVL